MALQIINSETRQRHDFVDATLGEAYSHLQDTEQLRAALGETAVHDFSDVISHTYVPNIRHGVVRVSPKMDDRIPIIAVDQGRDYFVPYTGQTTRQAQETARVLAKYIAVGEVDTSSKLGAFSKVVTRHKSERKRYDQFNVGTAAVWGRNAKLQFAPHVEWVGKNPTRRIAQRPVVAFGVDTGEPLKDSLVPTSILLHEIAHVLQFLRNPVRRFDTVAEAQDQLLRDELEAYHVGSIANTALSDSGYENVDDHSRTIENIRLVANAGIKDKFRPSGTIRNELTAHGKGHIAEIDDSTIDRSKKLY